MTENTTTMPTARSIGLKFGLYYGVFSIVYFIVIALVGANPFDQTWNWVGIIFSVGFLVWAHITFKNEGDGYMSFGQGVGIGFWITLVSLIIGGLFTFFYITMIDPGLFDGFMEMQRANMEAQGMPDNQIEMSQEWTKKLFWPFYVVIGLFFGVLIAVIVTIFTQRKNPEPFT
jgi:hypothetical protein